MNCEWVKKLNFELLKKKILWPCSGSSLSAHPPGTSRPQCCTPAKNFEKKYSKSNSNL